MDIKIVGFGERASSYIQQSVENHLANWKFADYSVRISSPSRIDEPYLEISGEKNVVEDATQKFRDKKFRVKPLPFD